MCSQVLLPPPPFYFRSVTPLPPLCIPVCKRACWSYYIAFPPLLAEGAGKSLGANSGVDGRVPCPAQPSAASLPLWHWHLPLPLAVCCWEGGRELLNIPPDIMMGERRKEHSPLASGSPNSSSSNSGNWSEGACIFREDAMQLSGSPKSGE